jgi:hypothetical protein
MNKPLFNKDNEMDVAYNDGIRLALDMLLSFPIGNSLSPSNMAYLIGQHIGHDHSCQHLLCARFRQNLEIKKNLSKEVMGGRKKS